MSLTTSKYWGPIKYLGGTSIILVVFGLIFLSIMQGFPEDVRNQVLINAIPFVAFFVAILLVYILFIFIVALQLMHKVPHRTHRAIELAIIAGIFIGIVALFQPWHIVGFEFGFTLLVFATLGFILWSHVPPRSKIYDKHLPPFSSRGTMVGAVSGLVVVVLLTVSLASVSQPAEPYGFRQRQWDFMDDDQKTEIIAQAESEFTGIRIPFYVFISLIPASIVFFAIREALTKKDESLFDDTTDVQELRKASATT